MSKLDSILDDVARLRVWEGLSPARLIPLLESAELVTVKKGKTLFEQFHPAGRCYLLISGRATQSTTGGSRTDMVQPERVDWPYAALGWSGFLPPRRYATTVVARKKMTLLAWSHDVLASLFYTDPELSIRFFDLVLDSVTEQLLALRMRRVASSTTTLTPPEPEEFSERRPVVGRADSCLRRSAFFAPFDDAAVDQLADEAVLESWEPGARIAGQSEDIDGLLLLASGRCRLFFEKTVGDEVRLVPFRSVHNHIGIVSGVPSAQGFVAEASVYAESHCWTYRVPASALVTMMREDPELGRAIQQRLLARLAGLVGALQVERNPDEADPEVALVANIVVNSQARLPITSDLHKVPHLLSHRLTISNAFATLHKVAETGRYHERLLAGRCIGALANLAAEDAFYRQIIEACEGVVSADEALGAEQIRADLDAAIASAFNEIDCRIIGEDRLPAEGGNIFILNHLGCPVYYQLPNDYHFSFDTAFVSVLAWKHFGASPIRVVRESPDNEFGHNLFYRRLGHITVPTIESDVEGLSKEAFKQLRRAAAEQFFSQGAAYLSAGANLLICPEGQSQPAHLSPARFHTGAFRLAVDTGARIVPVALAGFHRRFKDGPLVAIVGDPIDVGAVMKSRGFGKVREFADGFRNEFAKDVARAAAIAAEPGQFPAPSPSG